MIEQTYNVYWLPSFPCSWTKYTNAQFVSAQQDLIRFHIYYWNIFARKNVTHSCRYAKWVVFFFFGREPSSSSSVSLVKYWLVDIEYYSYELIKFPRPPPSAFASCMQTGSGEDLAQCSRENIHVAFSSKLFLSDAIWGQRLFLAYLLVCDIIKLTSGKLHLCWNLS